MAVLVSVFKTVATVLVLLGAATITSHAAKASTAKPRRAAKQSSAQDDILDPFQPGFQYQDMSEQAELQDRAMKAMSQGNSKEAFEAFQQLSALLPYEPTIWLNMAIVSERLGNQTLTVSLFRQALHRFRRVPSLYVAACKYASTVINRKESNPMTHEELVSICKRAVDLDFLSVEAHTVYGSALVLLNLFDKAVVQLGHAFRLAEQMGSPEVERYSILSNKALAHLRGGHKKQALESVEELREKFPGNPNTVSQSAAMRGILKRYDAQTISETIEALQLRLSEFDLRTPDCSTGKWKASLNLTEFAEAQDNLLADLDEWIEAVSRPSTSRDVVATVVNPDSMGEEYGGEMPTFVGPPLDPYKPSFTERQLVLGASHGVSLLGGNGYVLKGCTMHSGCYGWNMDLQDFPKETSFVRKETWNGRYASTFPLKSPTNYYHWLCEGLPRALFFREFFLDKPEFADVKLIVPPLTLRHVRESLKLVGIPKERLQEYTGEYLKRIVIPDWVFMFEWYPLKGEPFGSLMEDSWSTFFSSRAGLQIVQSAVRSAVQKHLETTEDVATTTKGRRVLYLSRKVMKLTRTIYNQHQLVQALQAQLRPQDELEIHTGEESVIEQWRMFAMADIVIGAHGAGMSNLVACRPRTLVILFPMEPHSDHTFNHLAAALDLKLEFVTTITSYYYGQYGQLSSSQIQDAAGALAAALRENPPAQAHPLREEL